MQTSGHEEATKIVTTRMKNEVIAAVISSADMRAFLSWSKYLNEGQNAAIISSVCVCTRVGVRVGDSEMGGGTCDTTPRPARSSTESSQKLRLSHGGGVVLTDTPTRSQTRPGETPAN